MKTALKKLIAERINSPQARPAKKRRVQQIAPFGLAMGKECQEAVAACERFRGPDETVYIVRCGDFAKIGYTRGTVESRMASFVSGSPHDFEILARIPGGYKLEVRLHKIFSAQHHRGEWFRLAGALEEFVHIVPRLRFHRAEPRISYLEETRRELERIDLCRALDEGWA